MQFLDHRGRSSLRQTHPSLRNAVDEYCEAVLQHIRTNHRVDEGWEERIGTHLGRSPFERLCRAAMNVHLYRLPEVRPGYSIWNFCLSPDKSRMATLGYASDFKRSNYGNMIVQIWNLATKECDFSFSVGKNECHFLCFIGEDLIAKARPGAMDVWEISTGAMVRSFDLRHSREAEAEATFYGSTVYAVDRTEFSTCLMLGREI